MLNSSSIGAWGLWVAWEAVSGPKTKFLPSSALLFSADIWSFQLIIDAFSSGIRAGKVAGSFREGNLLEESLPVVILGAVGILRSELMLSSSLSPEEDEDTASEKGFLEAKETKTLLEERLAIR